MLFYRDKQGNTAGLVIFAGANINENGNPLQASPLHLAVQQYNPNVVQVLVQAECDLTLKVQQLILNNNNNNNNFFSV